MGKAAKMVKKQMEHKEKKEFKHEAKKAKKAHEKKIEDHKKKLVPGATKAPGTAKAPAAATVAKAHEKIKAHEKKIKSHEKKIIKHEKKIKAHEKKIKETSLMEERGDDDDDDDDDDQEDEDEDEDEDQEQEHDDDEEEEEETVGFGELFDANQDQYVTLDEVKDVLSKQYKDAKDEPEKMSLLEKNDGDLLEVLKGVFTKADVNKDGKLSAKEIESSELAEFEVEGDSFKPHQDEEASELEEGEEDQGGNHKAVSVDVDGGMDSGDEEDAEEKKVEQGIKELTSELQEDMQDSQ